MRTYLHRVLLSDMTDSELLEDSLFGGLRQSIFIFLSGIFRVGNLLRKYENRNKNIFHYNFPDDRKFFWHSEYCCINSFAYN